MAEILDLIGWSFVAGFLILGFVWQARRFDAPKGWRVRALAISALAIVVSIAVAAFWDNVFAGRHLFDLSGLGMLGGAAVGILVYETAHYLYHRAAHEYEWIWRGAHQMHHSAESLDVFGAYFGHPFDVVAFTSLASLVFFPLLGVTLEAGVLGSVFLTFNALFQHANIETPRWIGYLIQRPEMHGLHHGRGLHRYNYSDLPVIDMLFGTYRNPRQWNGECGFYKGASTRIGDMLVGSDVSTDREAEGVPVNRYA